MLRTDGAEAPFGVDNIKYPAGLVIRFISDIVCNGSRLRCSRTSVKITISKRAFSYGHGPSISKRSTWNGYGTPFRAFCKKVSSLAGFRSCDGSANVTSGAPRISPHAETRLPHDRK